MKHMQGVDPIVDEIPEKHYLLFDHPIITMIVMFLLFLGIDTLIILGANYAGLPIQGEYKQLINAAAMTVSALILAIFFKLRFNSTYDGMFGWSTVGLLMVLPALAFVVHNLYEVDKMQFVFLDPEEKMNPILNCVIMALAPGVSEEILFRGIPGANWMRVADDEGDVMKCALVTSVAFGLIHGINALSGAPIFATIFQVCYAAILGFFFSAVFLRTGSIWPTMIAHTLIDFAGFLFMDLSKNGLLTEELVIDTDFFVTCGLVAVVALLGLIMLRRSKREQILQLWHRKWHQSGVVEQSRFRY